MPKKLVGFSYHMTAKFSLSAGFNKLTPLKEYMADIEMWINPRPDWLLKEALEDGYIDENEYQYNAEAAKKKCVVFVKNWALRYWEGTKAEIERGLRG